MLQVLCFHPDPLKNPLDGFRVGRVVNLVICVVVKLVCIHSRCNRIRTYDLFLMRESLYLLSYTAKYSMGGDLCQPPTQFTVLREPVAGNEVPHN